MKTVHIKQKLADIGVSISDLILGDYDAIARFTAEKQRDRNDPLYKSVGCFFTPNRERGILISSLMKQYNLKNFLEIGFGRGYTSLCVAKYLYEYGVDGSVTTIDPKFDTQLIEYLKKIFPAEWFARINFLPGMSSSVLPTLQGFYDLVYIDGDHSYEGTKLDWELSKKFEPSVVVFDDYHMPSKNDPGIQCAKAIDEIDEEQFGYLEKEFVKTDRRIFIDDRNMLDIDIDYGQIVLTKKSAKLTTELW